MRTLMIVVAGLSIAIGAQGKPAPDIAGFAQRIKPVADFVFLGDACRLIGYKVGNGRDQAFDAAMGQAVQEGIEPGTAAATLVEAMNRAAESEKLVSDDFWSKRVKADSEKSADAASIAMSAYYDHINSRCKSFAEWPATQGFISAPVGDEIKTGFNSFKEWVENTPAPNK